VSESVAPKQELPQKPKNGDPKQEFPPKPKVEEEDEGIDEYLDKMHSLLAKLGEVVEKLSTSIASSHEVSRGISEAVGKMSEKFDVVISKLDNVEKLVVGYNQAAKEHKDTDKFPISGSPKASGVGETVSVPDTHEPGIESLHKAVKVVAGQRAGVEVVKNVPSDAFRGLVSDILAGRVRNVADTVSRLKTVTGGAGA